MRLAQKQALTTLSFARARVMSDAASKEWVEAYRQGTEGINRPPPRESPPLSDAVAAAPLMRDAAAAALERHNRRMAMSPKERAEMDARADLPATFKEHLRYLDALRASIPGPLAIGKADDASNRPRPAPVSDRYDLSLWRRADRAAWAEYRKWEDRRFPINPAHPFRDPPGMVAARRAFEREQEISKAKEILRQREASRVR
jgi:hypothetical protein